MNTNYLNTSYFTLGQSHVHRFGNITLDKDIIIKVTANDPRKKMFELFGSVWSMQYDKCPDLRFFPRGIYDVTKGKLVSE